MYPSITQPRKAGFNAAPYTGKPVAQQQSNRAAVFTDVELQDAKVPFDYVATAVNFIISNMFRADALASAFREHASNWMGNHPHKGKLLTHVEVNEVSDDLLFFLRNVAQAAQATRGDAVAKAVSR